MKRVVMKRQEQYNEYLLRVVVELLEDNPDLKIAYDKIVCDAQCLANDLRAQFDIPGLEE